MRMFLTRGKGILFDSGEQSGLTSEEAIPVMGEQFGRMVKQYRLRDWIVSRQRYWGVPIPIIHCKACGPVAVPDKQLPVLLPNVKDYLPTGDGKSPLAKVRSFVKAKCPECSLIGERETDTFDTFVDSSWYFLRYTDPKNSKEFAARKKQDAWMPIDLYSGGAEHTTMHVLYSRFWQKALYDLKLVNEKEPYARRMNRSLIMGPDGQKMSKSRGNVIDPDAVVAKLGADTVRMYLAFIGPYSEVGSYPWNPDGVVGVRRFLERVWRLQESVQVKEVEGLQTILHQTIKKVGDDIPLLKFNTAIAQMMIFLNAVEKEKAIGKKQWQIFLQLLAPFAPHMAEELWSAGGSGQSIHKAPWPKFNPKLLQSDEVTMVVQINGKTRAQFKIRMNADNGEVEKAAYAAAAERLQAANIVRVVVVPNRLVNFVVADK
jgi:leucyl-tRNA synthetase